MGKAAVHQPALAILSHTPSGATETICWAGKGIVYDTGGLSIKGKVSFRVSFPFYVNVISTCIFPCFEDCHARNEERLWRCCRNPWSFPSSCQTGVLTLISSISSHLLLLFPC